MSNGRTTRKFKQVNGWRMHYVDEGTGDPVVLLHGNPAWGFLYRKFIKPLTEAGRRVIVPDMVGSGCPRSPSANRPTRSTATSPI
jgi:pimeloyl-ACP methyl ester carboxylesterase